MSNPWSRASPLTWPLGPNQTTDNFSGLPNGQAKCLGVISPSTLTQPFGDVILPPWQYTTAAGPTAGNTIQRYMLFSEDNVIWPGGINPTAITDQSVALTTWLAADSAAVGGSLLDTITIQSGAILYKSSWRSIRGLVGDVPTYMTVLVWNQSGVALAAFSANNQSATYVLDTYV